MAKLLRVQHEEGKKKRRECEKRRRARCSGGEAASEIRNARCWSWLELGVRLRGMKNWLKSEVNNVKVREWSPAEGKMSHFLPFKPSLPPLSLSLLQQSEIACNTLCTEEALVKQTWWWVSINFLYSFQIPPPSRHHHTVVPPLAGWPAGRSRWSTHTQWSSLKKNKRSSPRWPPSPSRSLRETSWPRWIVWMCSWIPTAEVVEVLPGLRFFSVTCHEGWSWAANKATLSLRNTYFICSITDLIKFLFISILQTLFSDVKNNWQRLFSSSSNHFLTLR